MKQVPSMDQWLKEAKADETAAKCGMYLVHNGVVREDAKAKVRGGDENGVDVVNQAVDGARFKEIRRNDGGGVQAEFLGVSGKFPRVRNGKCADVNDDEKFSFAVVCPGFHDGFAFGNGATNAFAGRAANVSANNALFDEQINLLRNFCEVDAPVGIERRMRCGNKSLEFLGHNLEYWFGEFIKK